MKYLRFWALPLLLALIFFVPTQAASQSSQDHWGRNLPWPKQPQRILSLSPASTEMLYAIGAQKLVVGVTSDCNYPPAAKTRPQVGRFGQIQLEKILKLKPDLILATADMGKALEPLRQLSVPVLALKTPDIHSIQGNLQVLGELTGHQHEAQQLQKQMQAQVQALKAGERGVTALYLVTEQPLIVATPQSFIGDALNLAGAQNVVPNKQAPFIHYSLEALLKSDPEVLILPQSLKQRLNLQRPPFNRLTAVKKQHLLYLDDDEISRPGPRVIQAMQQIHAYLQDLP